MKENVTDQSNENFSEDATENLQMENQILKLKMQAQFGAIFGSSEAGLSPEIENQFLKNIQQIENAWEDARCLKIYDLLDRPTFKKLENLSLEELDSELLRMKRLLEAKDIYLTVLGEYEPSVIYRFITEEFFEHETEVVNLPGFQSNFTYEDFHPNHKMDIELTAHDFLRNWFNRSFDKDCLQFERLILTSDGLRFTDKEIISKLNQSLATYSLISNEQYTILETSFEWNDDQDSGMGCTEGIVQYRAEFSDEESVCVEGSFKFYVSNTNGYWNIFYFIFPGFDW